MRISDWSSDVCSSDLERDDPRPGRAHPHLPAERPVLVQQGGAGMTAMDTSESRAGKSRVGFLRSTPARVAKRSAERRVGKEWVCTCKSRWSPYNLTKKTFIILSYLKSLYLM